MTLDDFCSMVVVWFVYYSHTPPPWPQEAKQYKCKEELENTAENGLAVDDAWFSEESCVDCARTWNNEV